LGSLASLERLKGSHDQEDPARSSDASLRINEEQLRSLGMGEPQIKELAKTRQITRDITLTSPIDGIVLSRDVSPGQRFEKGTEFYRIADLRKVWITADLFAGDTQFFAPGARVRPRFANGGKPF
jgi:membrane fusion protein, copper/silver efflux system